MDTEKKAVGPSGPGMSHDEIDFTSGYETQYRKEYSPLTRIVVPPPEKKHAWYRNWSSILMMSFLSLVFVLGTIMLVVQVFTASPLQIFAIVAIYVALAAVMIWIEVKSIKVR
ncbi:hypothetical protein KR018_010257 [Drosophila ironensis]|nr:hypothetical protein KR018_010257 [Drosophila ironensis]